MSGFGSLEDVQLKKIDGALSAIEGAQARWALEKTPVPVVHQGIALSSSLGEVCIAEQDAIPRTVTEGDPIIHTLFDYKIGAQRYRNGELGKTIEGDKIGGLTINFVPDAKEGSSTDGKKKLEELASQQIKGDIYIGGLTPGKALNEQTPTMVIRKGERDENGTQVALVTFNRVIPVEGGLPLEDEKQTITIAVRDARELRQWVVVAITGGIDGADKLFGSNSNFEKRDERRELLRTLTENNIRRINPNPQPLVGNG